MANKVFPFLAYSDIISLTFSFTSQYIVGSTFTATGMTENHVCCDNELPDGAFNSNGGLSWETRKNAVYIETADRGMVDETTINKSITLHFGIPVNT